MVSLKTAHFNKAHDDITLALNNPDISPDDMLRVYAAHSSTTAPDMSTVNAQNIHIANPVKARNLREVINTIRTHIATYPEEKQSLNDTIAYTRQLVDEDREYCLVDYDTYQVKDSSPEAVRETLSNYQSDLKRQLDLSYGIDRTEPTQPATNEPTLEL